MGRHKNLPWIIGIGVVLVLIVGLSNRAEPLVLDTVSGLIVTESDLEWLEEYRETTQLEAQVPMLFELLSNNTVHSDFLCNVAQDQSTAMWYRSELGYPGGFTDDVKENRRQVAFFCSNNGAATWLIANQGFCDRHRPAFKVPGEQRLR